MPKTRNRIQHEDTKAQSGSGIRILGALVFRLRISDEQSALANWRSWVMLMRNQNLELGRMTENQTIIPIESVERRILTVRGQRVILDRDLAELYGVPTFRFNEAVKRNRRRFPEDFAFQLTREELADLISQDAISSSGHGGLRELPWAFTEHGATGKSEA